MKFKELSPTLASLQELPEFGGPPFPIEELKEKLKAFFKQSDLDLKYEIEGWTQDFHFEEKQTVALFLTPIEEPLYFVIGREDLEKLLATFFEKPNTRYFLEKNLQKTFLEFFSLGILKEIASLKATDPFTLHLGEATRPKKTPHYKIDLFLRLGNVNINGMLFIPEEVRRRWKEQFGERELVALPEKLKKSVVVELGVEIGYVDIAPLELRQAKKGDVIVLDRLFFDLQEKSGTVAITLEGKKLFRGKVKADGIQILAYPHLMQEEVIMEDEDFEEFEFEVEEVPKMEETETKQEMNLKEIPLHVAIELKRLKMTLEELANLSPGSFIEVTTEENVGVDLVVNGRKLGRGEIVKLGEAIGVRLTEL